MISAVLEVVIGVVASAVIGIVTYWMGRRAGSRSEARMRDEVADVPARTAELVGTMIDRVNEPPGDDDELAFDRGWESQYVATTGYADLGRSGPPYLRLIEFPLGAHSACLLAVEEGDYGDTPRIVGTGFNGVGARFHVREASDGSGSEVVTLDYVKEIPDELSLADAPTQAVYYRLRSDGFTEVGRGRVYDKRDPWDIPRSVEPFLNPRWVEQQRGID